MTSVKTAMHAGCLRRDQRRSIRTVRSLAFLYENNPEQRHQARSPRHLGSCTLDSTNQAPKEITGVYFTDRYTKGDMTLTLVDRSTGHPSFSAAEAHPPKTTRWWEKKSEKTAS